MAVGFPNGFWVVVGLTGDPAADLLTGQTVYAAHDQEFDGGVTGRRWKLYRPFIEDNWRVTKKSLTLNLGLAWALTTPISEVANRASRTSTPPTGSFWSQARTRARAPELTSDLTALEPRIGAAWKPFGSTTVLRGGYAIFHDSSWKSRCAGSCGKIRLTMPKRISRLEPRCRRDFKP